jgi:hypothetical protein
VTPREREVTGIDTAVLVWTTKAAAPEPIFA